jgi:hypothetical protein
MVNITAMSLTLTDARSDFARLREQAAGVEPAALDAIWAALAPAAVDEVLGTWKGADFATGHRLHEGLISTRWYGKTFVSPTDAKPLMCYDENGELFSNTRLGNGEASLWPVEFRGEVTATMVYDGMPVLDHFKWVDENTLMGIMNGKPQYVLDKGQFYYFLLERA